MHRVLGRVHRVLRQEDKLRTFHVIRFSHIFSEATVQFVL